MADVTKTSASSTISSDGRSRIMRSIRKTDTRPERIVRRLVHRLGFRFRLHRRGLPGTPDLLIPRRRAVIFVHGCFWHQHSGCQKGAAPRSRTEYWLPKLARNIERDLVAQSKLIAGGYRVLIVWECETADQETLCHTLLQFLSQDSSTPHELARSNRAGAAARVDAR